MHKHGCLAFIIIEARRVKRARKKINIAFYIELV